ncbi:MAG: hypothetical protein LBR47_07890, partial [Spirochaetaceae bacterium]|nr:hypothetical protein [Spirochaetaceae bacterium]
MSKIVKTILYTEGDIPEKAKQQVTEAAEKTIDYSDIPEMTGNEFQETLAEIKRRTKKVLFSLRLKPETIEGWKALAGNGYTTVMA